MKKPAALIYKTPRLMIRPLRESDYEAWLESQERTGPAVDKFDTPAKPRERRSLARFKKSVREQERSALKDRRYVWNIFLKTSGELVGFMDLKPISRDPHKLADIGYFITNSYRRNGYGREALRALVKGIFKDLDLRRLEAMIDIDNKASMALARKSGFYREGIRKHCWFQNGRWEDQMIFVATPELFR
jgi:RimJ/RimL family protein N-acetyltransferase